MKTLKETFVARLQAQAQEAQIQGLSKVAHHVKQVVNQAETRPDNASYSYQRPEVTADVEGSLWQAIVRIADFYDCHIDAAEMQQVIEKASSELMKEVRTKGGVTHGVGAYEDPVPGEQPSRVTIEVE